MMSTGGMSSADEDEPTSPNRGTIPLSAISEAEDGNGSGSDSDASSVGGAAGSPKGVSSAARLVEKLRISRENSRLSESVAMKSGYLMKKGERRKAWKKRWFVLRGGQVAMYKNDKVSPVVRSRNDSTADPGFSPKGVPPAASHSRGRHPHLLAR